MKTQVGVRELLKSVSVPNVITNTILERLNMEMENEEKIYGPRM